MIQITEAEGWAFNVLNGAAQNAQAELNRTIAARASFIQLLETKYNATFNSTTGQLEPREKEEH